MPLSDYLSPSNIIMELAAENKDQALEALVKQLASACPDLDRGGAVRVLYQREALGSTGIGDGIAIPHGKVDGCEDTNVVIARSTPGCEFDAMDKRKCHIFCMLLAPQKAAAMHLSVLAHFVRILKNGEFRRRFMEAQDAEAVWRLLESFWRD